MARTKNPADDPSRKTESAWARRKERIDRVAKELDEGRVFTVGTRYEGAGILSGPMVRSLVERGAAVIVGREVHSLARVRRALSLLQLRSEVAVFALAMEWKLRSNDHKGGWKDCTLVYLRRRLDEETIELNEAMSEGAAHAFADTHGMNADTWRGADAQRVLDEAADVGNFAMMIADVCRARVGKIR